MKKILFAAQVFGIIAAFPLYVITELNHKPKPLPEQGSPSVVTPTRPQPASMVKSVTMYPVTYTLFLIDIDL